MSKRPSFQFYPADWQSNANLRRCSFEERGIWLEIMCYMHDSEEYGILRWTLEEISIALGCPITKLDSLRRKGALKGTDEPSEKVSFSDTFAQRQGPPLRITLIEEQNGPLWYSSRMVRDEHIRRKRAEGGKQALNHPNVPKKITDKDTLSLSNKDTISSSYKDTFSGTFDCSSSSSSSSSTSTERVTFSSDSPPIKKSALLPDFAMSAENRKLAFEKNLDPDAVHQKFIKFYSSSRVERDDWNVAETKWILDERPSALKLAAAPEKKVYADVDKQTTSYHEGPPRRADRPSPLVEEWMQKHGVEVT